MPVVRAADPGNPMAALPRRSLVAVSPVALLTGCDSLQESEPLAKTVPTAAVFLAVGAAVVVAVVRTTLRHLWPRPGEAAPTTLRWPRLTAMAIAGPVLALAVALLLFFSWAIAFWYAEPRVTSFSWFNAVVLAAVLTASALVAAAIGCALAGGASSGRPGSLLASRIVLGVLIVGGGLVTSGLTLVWLPGLVLTFATRRPRHAPAPAG